MLTTSHQRRCLVTVKGIPKNRVKPIGISQFALLVALIAGYFCQGQSLHMSRATCGLCPRPLCGSLRSSRQACYFAGSMTASSFRQQGACLCLQGPDDLLEHIINKSNKAFELSFAAGHVQGKTGMCWAVCSEYAVLIRHGWRTAVKGCCCYSLRWRSA